MANMLQLITKNIFHKKETRQFPAGPERDAFERSRGRIHMEPENCILCSICARRCPADAITVDRNTGKWELNTLRCIICGECVNACPKKCIDMTNNRRHGTIVKGLETIHKEVPKPQPKPAAPAAKPAPAAPATAATAVKPAEPVKPVETTNAAEKVSETTKAE